MSSMRSVFIFGTSRACIVMGLAAGSILGLFFDFALSMGRSANR
jgi:hypothetical protein